MPMKQKTSLSLNRDALDEARALGLNVSAIATQAIEVAVAEAKRSQWLKENEAAFAAQAKWHEDHGHPLEEVMATPGKETWRR